ncbi:hypothetical protein C1I98_02095 [Spongiactinospora gelatinilytica]|uniref:Sulphotransferase Stf0 domain-containing protein n=1 Tax=Spongiactinospora gelatinilytica TaxID=2666298 RepID=A0A2W2H7Y5_9ACTN|nr:hypothetical protein C1I98_02095 [Spongiactinospora gelatinilytica]
MSKSACLKRASWPYRGAVTESRDAAGRVDSYFVCATPRTGSSLLLGLLESTGVAGRPQAYFRRPDEPLWADRWRIPRAADGSWAYADFLRTALAEGRGENGVFGAKLMWESLGQMLGELRALYPEFDPELAEDDARLLTRVFGRTRLVFVRRDDVVDRAGQRGVGGVVRLGRHAAVCGAL